MKYSNREQFHDNRDVTEHLMTFAEYAGERHDTPYIFEIKAAGKQLIYFGARHSHDVGDPEFIQIENSFRKLSPQAVLVEGKQFINEPSGQSKVFLGRMTRSEVILKTGESGFAAWLAVKKGVSVESPEPELKDEIADLLHSGFTRETVAVFYFFRQVAEYTHNKAHPTFDAYIAPYLDEFRAATQWDDFDYSRSHMELIGGRLWGEKMSFEMGHYDQRIDPTPWPHLSDKQTVINEVARRVSRYRDAFSLSRMKDILKKKDRIMIVFGASHAYMQEAAVKKLIGSVEIANNG